MDNLVKVGLATLSKSLPNISSTLGSSSNSSSEFEYEEPKIPIKYLEYLWEHHRTFSIILGSVATLTAACGLIGHILTIIVLSRSTLRTIPLNLLLLTLSVWDSVFILTYVFSFNSLKGLSQLFFWDETSTKPSPLWVKMYPLIYPAFMMSSFGSFLFTLLVTLERYLAVCHPFYTFRRGISLKTIYVTITIGCIITVALFIPEWWWLEVKQIHLNDHTVIDKVVISSFAQQHPRYYHIYTPDFVGISLFLFRYLFPFFFLCFCNFRIGRTIREAEEARKTMSTSPVKMVGMTKQVLAIVSVSALTNLLFILLAVWMISKGSVEDKTSNGIAYFGSLYGFMLLINSAINFVFYCAFGSRFRHECFNLVKWAFKLKRCSNKVNSSNFASS